MNESSIELALTAIKKMTDDAGRKIAIKPTKAIIPLSIAEYIKRRNLSLFPRWDHEWYADYERELKLARRNRWSGGP